MLQTIVLFAHLIVAGLIISLVLLQRGKGAEAGTGFGAGASGTVFGSRGTSNFFSRSTAVLATLFFATSLALAYFATQTRAPDSVLDGSVLDSGGPALLPQEDAELPVLETAPPATEVGNADSAELPDVEQVEDSSEPEGPGN